MMYDSTEDTLDHIGRVQARITEVVTNLVQRGDVHDASKLVDPEKSGYDRLGLRLATIEYGTDAYRAALAEARETVQHHYEQNSHHPEHYEDGINDMSLLDLIEMLADWKASGERMKNGSLARSLEVNRERFGISDQLYGILINTARELGWI